MSFALKLSDATFSTALKGLRLPSRDKLVGEYLLGVSEAESIKNRADPSNPLTVQGTPTYNAASATVRSSATTGYGFLTGIIPADDCTMILIRKNPATTGTTMFVAGMASDFIGFRHYTTDNYASNGEASNIKGAKRTRPATATDVYFEALVLSRQNVQRTTGGYGKMYHYAGGSQVEVVSTDLNVASRRGFDGKQIAIGSTSLTDSITTNSIEVYYFAIYQRPLTAAEIDAAKTALTTYYATRSVTLV